jgi:hypothetical protein
VLGNLSGGAPNQIARYVGQIALGQPVILNSERKEITVAPSILADYAGTYRVADLDADLIIAVKDDRLTAKLGKQNPVDLYAQSETKFFLKITDAQVEFFRDPTTHAVTHLTIYQNGNSHDGKKQ